jgi:hypothetical protein
MQKINLPTPNIAIASDHAGYLYGEIVHNIVFKCYTDVIIQIETPYCEIYNYKNDSWSNELYIGNLISNTEKIYQLKIYENENENTNTNINISINLYSEFYKQNIPITPSLNLNTKTDLTKYIFRQFTQKLLYKVNYLNRLLYQNKKVFGYNSQLNYLNDNQNENENINEDKENDMDEINGKNMKEKQDNLKEELNNLLQEMNNYMINNDLNDDVFMKMLCDDIRINIKLIGNRKALMYSCSRQTSQGEQRTYMVNINPNGYDLNGENNDNPLNSPYATEEIVETCKILNNNIN